MIKRLVRLAAFVLILLIVNATAYAACNASLAPVYSATNAADLQDCFTNFATHSGDSVHISGSGFVVSSPLIWAAPANSRLYGDGSTSITGGNDVTILTDQYTSQTSPISISTVAGTFRIYGITFRGGTIGGSTDQYSKYQGLVYISGDSTQIRVDHVHFDVTTYNVSESTSGIQFNGCTAGLVDHILWDANVGSINNAIRSYNQATCNSDAIGVGDQSWTIASNIGSGSVSRTIYIEDSIFNNGASNDCVKGGRNTLRYNTFNATYPAPTVQTHPTINRERGCRITEVYLNSFVATPNMDRIVTDAVWISSGTGVVWGNSAPGTHTATYQGFTNLISLHGMRRDHGTNYFQSPPPAKWGYCGPAYQTGTVNTSGTAVTKTAGSNFSTSWPAGSEILIDGSTFEIASVSSTTALTITASAGSLTGKPYVVGSNWDGNTDVNTGYPCLDQPGRGVGDLLTGGFIGDGSGTDNVTNSTNGGAIYSSPNAWPRQALEPIREWLDTWNAVPSNPGHAISPGDVFTANQDYYLGVNSDGTPITFTCATGVGTGTRAARPAAGGCVNGVGYWATDAGGNWDTTHGGANDGCLDVMVSGSWANCSYIPAPYPHPLAFPGTTYNAANCTPIEVMNKIGMAAAGDIVHLPTCSVAWSAGSVTLDKAITLRGSGQGNTIIDVSGTPGTVTFQITKSTTGVTRLEDMTINNTDTSNPSGHGQMNINGDWTTTQPLVVQHVTFNHSGSTSILAETAGGIVFSDITYNGEWNDFMLTVKDLSTVGATSWTTPDSMGTHDTDGKHNIYIENSTFNGGANSVYDCDDNCRIVDRHNVYNMSGGFNSHGYDSSPHGMRHFEIYNNTYNHPDGSCGTWQKPFLTDSWGNPNTSFSANINWYTYLRGGTGVIHDNHYEEITGCWGSKTEIKFSIRGIQDLRPQGDCANVMYPVPHQLGQSNNGSSDFTDPIIVWNNTGVFNSGRDNFDWGNPCGVNYDDFWQAGRDYVLSGGDGTGSSGKAGYATYTFPHPLVNGVSTPTILSLSPPAGNIGDTNISIAVVGSNTNFVNSTTTCSFGSNVHVNSCVVSNATHLTANVSIDSFAVPGLRDAVFTTGGETAILANGFTVLSITTGKFNPRMLRN